VELGVSYIPAHLPDHLATDMAHLAGIGCSEVLYCLQENHLYNLTGALDFGAHIASEHGLRPYAVIWGYANTFGGGRMSKVMLESPDMWVQGIDGTPEPIACLNNPKTTDEFVRFAEVARAAGYLGIFVDEPTKQACFCPWCQRAYRAFGGGDLAGEIDGERYGAFRSKVVSDYARVLCDRVKSAHAGMITITCVMPVDRDTWQSVAGIETLDVFGTDPYWLVSNGRMSLTDAVEHGRAMHVCGKEANKATQIWLNCWHIPAGLEDQVFEGGKALAQIGCDSLYTWSYRGGLGTNEACDRPDVAWESVTRLYRELSGRA